MKIFNKISFFLSLLVLFTFNANNAFAATAAATVYKVTVYRLAFCEYGSTLTNCSNPDEVEYRAAGLTMDIASVDAGKAAGSFGNLNKLKIGKTYSHGEVILNRQFTMAGAGLSPNGTACQTNASGDAGTEDTLAKGKAGTGDTEEQVVYIKSSEDMNTFVQSTSASNGSGTDAADGVAADGHEFVRFRWAFTTPFSMTNKIPQVKIAFDVSAGLGFYNNTCTNAGISSEAPSITNTFTGL